MERDHEGTGPETTGNQEGEQGEQHEAERERGARIYVASLTDYNDGRLHGVWIDADQEPNALQADVDAMLARSPTGHAEEFAIHDYEGFGKCQLGEYDSLARVSRIARGIAEHGLAFAAFVEARGDEDQLERFEDAYLGDWPSVEAYADDVMDGFGWQDALYNQLPAALQPYVTIDTAGFARDLELSGDVTAVDHPGGVWIFDGTA
jgi:antirestriction protein